MKRSPKSEEEGKMREKASISLEREDASPSPNSPQKKQVRRRLHTRKPYQEKLLNMAEARREIVTALKLHRASMKLKTQPIQQPPQLNSSHHFYNNNYYWPPIFQQNDDFVLPDQALGLNLNLDDFITTDSASSIYSPSTSSSPPPPSAAAGVESFEFVGGEGVELVSSPFDEVMEFPSWLNANEEQHFNDFHNFTDPALPCMDIEEIEGMDGDWLA